MVPAPLGEPRKVAPPGARRMGRRAIGCWDPPWQKKESDPCGSLLLSPFLVLGAAGRFEASVIEERRKGAEDLLRFTVHIPALNNSPQLQAFFRVCVAAWPSSPAPGRAPCPLGCTLRPPPPIPAARPCLSLLQGGEVTRPSDMSRDLHILPPPLIPTPPPEEPWLPQPLPAERRGLEELEVPGTSLSGWEPGLEGVGEDTLPPR